MVRDHLRPGVLVLGAVLLTAACGKRQEAAPVPPPPEPPSAVPAPPEVAVTVATRDDAAPFADAIATLEGSTVTEVRATAPGYLVRQEAREGASVERGSLLFELDTRAFQTGANETPGQVNSNTTAITAPVAGVVGHAMHGLGDRVAAGDEMTTIATVDPIRSVFALPGKFVRDHAASIEQEMALAPADRPESFELIEADGTTYESRGKFDQVDHDAAASAGSVPVSVLFPNPGHALHPGEYVKIRDVSQRTARVVRIPQRCVVEEGGVDRIWVVKGDDTIEIRQVTIGDRSGTVWSVISGLHAGDWVVIAGMDKIAAGEKVTPRSVSDDGM